MINLAEVFVVIDMPVTMVLSISLFITMGYVYEQFSLFVF